MNDKIESEMKKNKETIIRIGKNLKDLGVIKMQIKGIKKNTIVKKIIK